MTHEDLQLFFRDCGAAFSRSASDVATYYHSPCIAARGGAVQALGTPAEVETFFADVLAKYTELWVSSGELGELNFKSAGANACSAVARWAYKSHQGSTLWEWTVTYDFYRTESGWKILLQVVHD